jgi:uncharacterized protein YycO
VVNNRKRYLYILIIAILLGFVFFFRINKEDYQYSKINVDNIVSLVEDGDVICRLGNRIWSNLFCDLSEFDKRYSHLGIVHIVNDTITIIHSEGDTGHGRDSVNEVSIETFLEFAVAVGIYRFNQPDRHYLSEIAKEFLGIPFDWKFDMADNTKLYCTELLYVVLKKYNNELKLKTIYSSVVAKDIIPLESVSDSEYFEEIYYERQQKK